MVKFVVTHKVDSHHTNPTYPCLLIDLLGDLTFHYEISWINKCPKCGEPLPPPKLTKANWMPQDDVMLDTTLRVADISPTFKKKLYATVSFW